MTPTDIAISLTGVAILLLVRIVEGIRDDGRWAKSTETPGETE